MELLTFDYIKASELLSGHIVHRQGPGKGECTRVAKGGTICGLVIRDQDAELVLGPKRNAGIEGVLLFNTPSCWGLKQTVFGRTDTSLVGNACCSLWGAGLQWSWARSQGAVKNKP